MSDTNPIPPPIPSPSGIARAESAEDGLPISGVFGAVESVLRQPGRIFNQLRQGGQGELIARLLLIAVVCSLVYGVVVGTFSRSDPAYQFWLAPLKIAMGLL